jgi:proteasome lid subunit RPN8/RPN11
VIEAYRKEVEMMIGAAAIAAAKEHARAEFPKESCGFIAGGKYIACKNKATDPNEDFVIEDKRLDKALKADKVQAIIHSHPNGPIFPTEQDMRSQIATDVPFGIITLNETVVSDMVAWGDSLPMAPLIGRPFIHGVFDCYAAVRDLYKAGKFEAEKQGIAWPLPPIELPPVARNDAWWIEQDLYRDHLEKVGFRIISRGEAQPGDGFLLAIPLPSNPKRRLNHAGLLVGREQVYHHLPGRISRREPAGAWARAADLWVRYEGPAK